jgi:hypothetical protein
MLACAKCYLRRFRTTGVRVQNKDTLLCTGVPRQNVFCYSRSPSVLRAMHGIAPTTCAMVRKKTIRSWRFRHNQKHHPDCSAVVSLLLSDCPLRLSGLSIYVRFSQSVTYIGLLATVSGQRRPAVSAAPLGSKYLTRLSKHSPLMHLVYPTFAYTPVPH